MSPYAFFFIQIKKPCEHIEKWPGVSIRLINEFRHIDELVYTAYVSLEKSLEEDCKTHWIVLSKSKLFDECVVHTEFFYKPLNLMGFTWDLLGIHRNYKSRFRLVYVGCSARFWVFIKCLCRLFEASNRMSRCYMWIMIVFVKFQA